MYTSFNLTHTRIIAEFMRLIILPDIKIEIFDI